MLGSWTYLLSPSFTWAEELREMHKVQWISGTRLFRVPPGVGNRWSDPSMGDQWLSRDEGTIQLGEKGRYEYSGRGQRMVGH